MALRTKKIFNYNKLIHMKKINPPLQNYYDALSIRCYHLFPSNSSVTAITVHILFSASGKTNDLDE